jgi:hypothetical protein
MKRHWNMGRSADRPSRTKAANAGDRNFENDPFTYDWERVPGNRRSRVDGSDGLRQAFSPTRETLGWVWNVLPLGPLLLTLLFLFAVTIWVMSAQYDFVAADIVL